MSLHEFYLAVTNQELPVAMQSTSNFQESPGFAEYQQSGDVGKDNADVVRDSIHLDWAPILPHCLECGVNVKIWENFAHRKIWNKTWLNSVAFQPLSMRYETERWDSPIEGFVFRLWTWHDPKDTFIVRKNKFLRNKNPTTENFEVPQNKNTELNKIENTRYASEDRDDSEISSFNSVYKSHNYNDDYLDNEDENAPQQIPQISPYGLFSNLLPFGHPSIGQRHLLAVETYNNSILSNNNHLNHIVHSKRKKHHRKSSSKKKNKMHNNHRRAYNYDYRANTERIPTLNKEGIHTINAVPTVIGNGKSKRTNINKASTRYLNLTETIYYATLNHTNLTMVNIFNHTVVQKCTYLYNHETYECSPHYNTQSNSSK